MKTHVAVRRMLVSLAFVFGAVLLLSTTTSVSRAGFRLGGHAESAHAQEARRWTRTDVRAASYPLSSMLAPVGIDGAPGGLFYVADRGRDRIVAVDNAGAVVRSFGGPGDGQARLNAPTDVAIDGARDRVYVADRGNRRLSVFTLEGTPVDLWRTAGPELAFAPWSVAVAPGTGDVYVLSRLQWGRIERFSFDGRWLGGWGTIGAGPGQFYYPEDLTVHTDGRVFVADTNNNRIQVFDSAGGHLASWTDQIGVRSVDVDPTNGNVNALLVGDLVRVFLANGTSIRELRSADLAAGFSPASRLGVGDDGRVGLTMGWGTQDGRHGVRMYDATGGLLSAAVSDPRAHTGFYRPDAIAVGPGGELHVADGQVRTTHRYAADGRFVGRLDEGGGDEIAVGAAGDAYVVDTRSGGAASLRSLAPTGLVRWASSCSCFNGAGVAASGDRLFVTQALSGTVAVYLSGQAANDPVAQLAIPDAPYAWPLDVAAVDGGRQYVAGGETGRIDVFEGAGGPVASWSVADGGGAARVDVAPDGTVFSLLNDGSIAVHRADGAFETRWTVEPVPGEPTVRPIDLAAGPGGRLYVIDDHSHAVLVYDTDGASSGTPTPEPTPDSPCTVTGDKTASPGTVVLGNDVTIELALQLRCPTGSETQADVVLVIDRSNSMSGSKLADAKAAAEAFVEGLDLSRHRVALVSFSDITSLDHPLTSDAAAMRGAIAGVQAHGSTDIAGALDRALRHLDEAARPDAQGVVLLMTDGEPSGEGQPYVDPVRLAGRARARGVSLFTIGLGTNVDEALLVAVAGAPDQYFFAPTESDLAAIYQGLSKVVGAVKATDVQVVDLMGRDVDYVPGSASNQPVEEGDRVTWAFPSVPAGGMPVLRLRVRPWITGTLETNDAAHASYTADGRRFTFTFPVPQVVVVEPPTPTPTPTATPTPVVTGPSTVYLPYATSGGCPKEQRRPADVLLLVDTSSSMQGDKLSQAVAASRRFVALLDPPNDRAGLVSFDGVVSLHGLTTDLSSIDRALDGLTPGEGTRIDLAMRAAVTELQQHGRGDGVAHVAVLLTDGRPTPGTRDESISAADSLRRSGGSLFTIGLGGDADETFLTEMADSRSHYFQAPSSEDLADIYDRIAVRLPCR